MSLPSKFKRTRIFFVFLALNFMALVISNWVMKDALNSNWYAEIAKAPWTPPPWFFGVAWCTIMTMFALYLTQLTERKYFHSFNVQLYAMILSLCIIWNVVFFALQMMTLGVFILISLALCVSVMVWINYRIQRGWSWLLAPFIAWGCIATSLNIYSVVCN